MSGAQGEQAASAGGGRRRLIFGAFVVVALGALGYLAYYLFVSRYSAETDDAYVAGDLVTVTAQQAGRVIAVNVANTQFAHKGDVLVGLDQTDAKVDLERAKAKLGLAVRSAAGLFDSSSADQANVEAAEAAVRQAEQDLARAKRLLPSSTVSQEQVQHFQATYDSAVASLARARNQRDANLRQVHGTTVGTNPNVLSAEADLRAAWLAMARTEVRAPIDGFVSQKNVQVGEQIDPSTPLLALVPLEDVWIDANFKETQIEGIRIGQPATVEADLYGSDVRYHGKVLGLSAGTGSAFALLPAENATGNWIKVVQRLPVRIGLQADELKAHPLSIGLSTTVTIDTHDRNGKMMSSEPVWSAHRTTDAYDTQMQGADAVIQQIIDANVPAGAPAQTARDGQSQ
jgi:membrane fusion protein (multidrug efflux system)